MWSLAQNLWIYWKLMILLWDWWAQKKYILYPLVYRLITLALLLPILTATMEKVFSVKKIVKTRLHNRINYQFFFDCLIKHIEKDAFNSVNNQIIIHYYHENSHRSIMNLFLLLFLNYKLLLVLCLCKWLNDFRD